MMATQTKDSSENKKSTEQGQLWHKRVSAHQKAGVKAADGGEHSRGGLFSFFRQFYLLDF